MIKSNYGSPEEPKKKKTASTGAAAKSSIVKKDDVQGINIDAKNKAIAQPHEVKVVKYGSGTSAKTKIIGTDGTVTYDGRNSDAATKEALRKTTNKVNDVMARRTNNADYRNNPDRKDPTMEKRNAKRFIK